MDRMLEIINPKNPDNPAESPPSVWRLNPVKISEVSCEDLATFLPETRHLKPFYPLNLGKLIFYQIKEDEDEN